MIKVCVKKDKLILPLILISALILTIILYNKLNKTSNITPESYLSSLGYESELIDETSLTIPQKFNKVLTDYNELQKEQGFDLSKYRGKNCVKKRFSVKSSKTQQNKYIVDLIIYNNKLIGGDLHAQTYNQQPMKIDSIK